MGLARGLNKKTHVKNPPATALARGKHGGRASWQGPYLHGPTRHPGSKYVLGPLSLQAQGPCLLHSPSWLSPSWFDNHESSSVDVKG